MKKRPNIDKKSTQNEEKTVREAKKWPTVSKMRLGTVLGASRGRKKSSKTFFGEAFGGQDGTKIDLGATFWRLGRTFVGDLAANHFFIDFLTILD